MAIRELQSVAALDPYLEGTGRAVGPRWFTYFLLRRSGLPILVELGGDGADRHLGALCRLALQFGERSSTLAIASNLAPFASATLWLTAYTARRSAARALEPAATCLFEIVARSNRSARLAL
jgi:hypothetical protein